MRDRILRWVNDQWWIPGFLKHALNWTFDHVISWVQDFIDAVHRTVGSVRSYLHRLSTLVASLTAHVVNSFRAVYGWVRNSVMPWAERLVGGVYSWMRGAVANVISWAHRGFVDIRNWTTGSLNWLRDHVWAPLVRAVNGAISWIKTSVVPTIKRWVDDLGQWARDAFNWTKDRVLDLVSWLDRYIKKWVPIFERWGKELLDILTDPFAWLAKKLRDIFIRAPSALAGLVVHMAQHEGDAIESFLAKWLSL